MPHGAGWIVVAEWVVVRVTREPSDDYVAGGGGLLSWGRERGELVG